MDPTTSQSVPPQSPPTTPATPSVPPPSANQTPLEPSVAPTPPPAPPQRKLLPLIIIGILVILILGLGIYIVMKGTAQKSKQPMTTKTSSRPTNKAKKKQTASKKRYRIYTNKKYGFMFKYPAALIKRKDATDETIGFLTKRNDTASQKLVVSVLPNPDNQEVEAFVKAHKPVPYEWTDTAFEKQTINGHEVIVKRSEKACTKDCDIAAKEKNFVTYVTGDTYIVSFAIDNRADSGDTAPDEKWIEPIITSFSLKK